MEVSQSAINNSFFLENSVLSHETTEKGHNTLQILLHAYNSVSNIEEGSLF